MKRVYIAGDYSADNIIDGLKNIGRGLHVYAQLFGFGFAPFAPWADRDIILQRPNEQYATNQFHDASMAYLEVSDCVYVISGRGNRGGVDKEIKRAHDLNIPVYYTQTDLINNELNN